jgi:hypothetical protein
MKQNRFCFYRTGLALNAYTQSSWRTLSNTSLPSVHFHFWTINYFSPYHTVIFSWTSSGEWVEYVWEYSHNDYECPSKVLFSTVKKVKLKVELVVHRFNRYSLQFDRYKIEKSRDEFEEVCYFDCFLWIKNRFSHCNWNKNIIQE